MQENFPDTKQETATVTTPRTKSLRKEMSKSHVAGVEQCCCEGERECGVGVCVGVRQSVPVSVWVQEDGCGTAQRQQTEGRMGCTLGMTWEAVKYS